MNKPFPLLVLFCAMQCHALAQDSAYTRKVIQTLCSEKFFGRGYVKKGLQHAERFLSSEMKSLGASPLFDGKFTQSFTHPINTFPSDILLLINGKTLQCGTDFIPGAENPGISGSCELQMKDSTTFTGSISGRQVTVKLRDKLTYTTGSKVGQTVTFELDKKRLKEIPSRLECRIRHKFIPAFESRNIGCFIPGQSDSTLVFTAHYDHLGGIGRHTYFPGANDNASGVSMLLNLMAHYSKHTPRYKMVFIFFAGEEAGLRGSEYFVSHPAIALNKIKFLVNLDLLGTGEEGIMVVNGAVLTEAFNRLESINNELHLLPQIKKRGKAANSDHYWFTEKGVPSFFIYTMGGTKAYHDVYDTEPQLPLSKYKEVFMLLTTFINRL